MREGKFVVPKVTSREDGVQVIEIEDNRWPDAFVISQQFGGFPHHERLRQLAHGYLSSAKTLANELGEHPDRLDWPRASAACFCYYHAVELFLKACILFKSPGEKLGHHDVAKLTDRYHELFPFDKFFAFQTPWRDNLRELARSLGGDILSEDFEDKHDQVFRYLSDKEGRSPKGIYVFAPGFWLSMMEHFEEDMDRVWENILETESQEEIKP